MVLSMTGFGRSKKQWQDYEVLVEMKTINHRFSEISIRMPRPFMKNEEKIKKMINQFIHRGRIEVFVNLLGNSITRRSLHIDWNLLDDYYQFISQLKNKYDISANLDVKDLLSHSDMINIEEIDEENEEAENLVLLAIKEALDHVAEMRAAEGEQLQKDLLKQLRLFSKCLNAISEYAPSVVQQYKSRLEKKIKELTDNQFDESRILTEVAIFADKSDIHEEITRLQSHIMQFEKTLMVEGPIGRKLDFIIQEMNREVNTIGSKGSDASISAIIVDMKTILEKMREQVQNIE